MKLSIRQGLLLLIALASITLAAVAGVGMWGTWRGQEGLRQVLAEEVEPIQQLIRIDKLLGSLPGHLYGVLNGDFGVYGARQHLLEIQKAVPLAWQEYRRTTAKLSNIAEGNLIASIETGMATLPHALDRLDGALEAGDLPAIAFLLKEDWWAVRLQIVTPVGKLMTLQQEHVAEAYAAAQDVYRQTLLGTALVLSVGLAMFLLFARHLFRYVLHKLSVIEDALGRIARGDLETRVGGSHRGEFGRIVLALDRTADTLREDRQAIDLLQQRQASILESMAEGLYGTDARGRITYVNAAAERLLGRSAAEMLGRESHPLFHHSRADGTSYPGEQCPLYATLLRQEVCTSAEEAFWRKDGSHFPVEFTGAPIIADARTVGTVVVFRDISERRADELARQRLLAELHQRNEQLNAIKDELSRKEEELRLVLHHLRDGVITVDARGMIRSANPAICTMFQQPASALQDEDLRILIPPDYRAAHAQGLNRHATTSEAQVLDRLVELEGLRSDGSRFPIELSINAYAVRGERFYSGIIRDISDRKAADRALHAALEQAQEYLDVALAVMVVIDCDLSVRLINRAGCALLGLSESEIVGSNWFDHFIPAPERESLRSSFLNWLAGTPSGVIAAHNHNDILTADGRVRRVAWSNALLRDESGTVTGNLSSGIDVTDQHAGELQLHATIERLTELNHKLEEAQNQLLQSEKMASIGQLAAGVAHEINNPVGFVNSNLGSLRNEVNDLLRVIDAYAAADPILAEHPALMDAINAARDTADLAYLREDVGTLIDESLDGLQRVRRIVQDLKDFSRVDSSEWAFASLEAGLDSTLNIVRNEIKYKAEVRKEYAGIPEVECIAAQVNQVFLNLLVNAAHAIDERGTITLRTGCDAREVWVEVEDSGKGIAPEVLQRIFEPFFTTKPIGQGTGLGLSLAYSIAQRHGGRIEASSQVGSGSKFRLLLPREREREQERGDAPAPADTAPPG
ncbi:PAS domain S-box protein [Accumulibacter sp.]|uniref:PAS domain S-box protein n=1 Tax=Accumulibacter sp. TaxID=2053492 RepID=UPI002D1F9A53|nr:PAS domain S-box protein [Accumulibacter sp.]